MKKLDHKLVCWGDYSIPVRENMMWMAFDKDGSCYCYVEFPSVGTVEFFSSPGDFRQISTGCILQPPEPGPWESQLYWID